LHELIGLAIGFSDPLGDFAWLGRIFELDGEGAIDFEGFDLAEIGLEGDNAAARRQVAVLFTVTVADVDVDRFALQAAEFVGLNIREQQVRDVDVGPDRLVIAVVEKADHCLDGVDERRWKGSSSRAIFTPSPAA
jgi:hypothetical protein